MLKECVGIKQEREREKKRNQSVSQMQDLIKMKQVVDDHLRWMNEM